MELLALVLWSTWSGFLLRDVSDADLRAIAEKADEAAKAVLLPMVYVTLILLPYVGTYILLKGLYGIQLEGSWRIFFGFVVFPMYPASIMLTVRIVRCCVENIRYSLADRRNDEAN